MDANPRDYPERPFLGVSVAVWREGRVLLVKRRGAPFAGIWSFPGGLVEIGELLEEAARREVLEESGIGISRLERAEVAEIVNRDENNHVRNHYVIIVFTAEFASGELRASDDAAEARWVAPKDLEKLELTEDTARILSRLKPRQDRLRRTQSNVKITGESEGE